MGGFYGSTQLRTADRHRVLIAAHTVARERNIKCLVGPALNGWVGVYPEGHGQDHTVGERLAAAVGGHALHVLVHDDDVLAYWLWHDGVLVDSYWSAPGYFGEANRAEEEPLVGDPERFAFVLDADRQAEMRKLLRRDEGPTFESDRLDRLGTLLGVRNAVSAYEYLKGGETDGVTGWPRRFNEMPPDRVVAEGTGRNAEGTQIRAERQRLKAAGMLLVSDERTEVGPIGCVAGDGFLVVWRDHRGGPTTVEYHRPPWDSPVPPSGLELPPRPHVTAVAVDATGRRLAMAAGDRVRVWDVVDGRWNHVTDVTERDLAVGVAVSPDGARVAHVSRKDLVVTDVATGRKLAKMPLTGDVRGLTFSPAGDWVAVAGDTLALMSLVNPAVRRDCHVGGVQPVSAQYTEAMRTRVETLDVESELAAERAEFDGMLTEARRRTGRGAMAASPEQLAAMRDQFEQTMAETRQRLTKLKRDGPPRVAKESCFCVGFDAAGQWMWVGTTVGLRVYDWAGVVAGSHNDLPSPIYAVELPVNSRMSELHRDARYVYTAVGEPDARGLVFGGMSDELFRLDLATGDLRTLTTMPGKGGVNALAMDPTGSALGVVSHWWSMATIKRQQKPRQSWEVWAYQRLAVGNA